VVLCEKGEKVAILLPLCLLMDKKLDISNTIKYSFKELIIAQYLPAVTAD